METRIKERLVGAIALVAIVVIVVPELLTGPRNPPASPASAAAPVHTVTIDLATSERGAIARPVAPAAVAAPPAAALAPPPVVAPASTTPAAGPATDAPASNPAAGAGVPAAPAEPAGKPPAGVPAAAAALPDARGPVAPRPLAHGAQAWVIQLGSFASRENAEHLATALKAKGYSAFVAEFRGSGRVLYRVRVGPEQDRARADAIAERLAREGHRGSVAPEP